jgi:hypothetical protein
MMKSASRDVEDGMSWCSLAPENVKCARIGGPNYGGTRLR